MIFQFNKQEAFAILILIFLSVQVIGIATAIQYNNAVEEGIAETAFENPEEISNAFLIFVYILVMTGVMLVVIKLKKKLIYVLEAIALFFTSLIVFDFLISYPTGLPFGTFLALGLTAWKMKWPTHFSQNIALIISVAGAGAVIGIEFDFSPIFLKSR